MDTIILVLAWGALIASAIMAGVYFCFSTFIMRSLDALEKPAGIMAMQSINKVIVKSAFLPVFFGGTICSAAIVALGLINSDMTNSMYLVAGGLFYFVGMFVVTVIGNVPLNNALEAVNAGSPEGEAMWTRYLREWVRWNHVRTIACLAATICLAISL